jgi:hypothetical protein
MANTAITLLALVLMFIGLPVLILRIIDRTRKASHAANREAYERRILTPDWPCVERQLRRPAPQALRDLYADRRLITQRDLVYDDDRVMSTFEPLDEQAIADTRQWLGFEAVAIATTDFGDTVYLRSGAGEVDAVYLAHHDGGDIEIVAESVIQMHETLTQHGSRT